MAGGTTAASNRHAERQAECGHTADAHAQRGDRRVEGQSRPSGHRPQGNAHDGAGAVAIGNPSGDGRAQPIVGRHQQPSRAVGEQVAVPELPESPDLPGKG